MVYARERRNPWVHACLPVGSAYLHVEVYLRQRLARSRACRSAAACRLLNAPVLLLSSLQAVAGKVCVSLLSPTAFTFAADLIGAYEGGGQGLHWGDLWADPYPLGAVLIMLTIDAKLYALLAWCAPA